jgi:hypothetical protein
VRLLGARPSSPGISFTTDPRSWYFLAITLGTNVGTQAVLNLRVGELVQIKSAEEILTTLDEHGEYDSLPFMPEMLRFCGKRFRVYRRADKACDTIDWSTLRRMENAVHLAQLRCDGSGHGGCQAGCLLYWKEAWLERVSAEPGREPDAPDASEASVIAVLEANTTKGDENGEPIYSCQATELKRAARSELPWWQPAQYVQDIRSGNATFGRVVRGLVIGFFNKLQQVNTRFLPRFALIHGGSQYPFLDGHERGKHPDEGLNLKPGELIEVKSKDEILDTLDERDYTRGLRFDREMLRYCGRRGRVLRRVERLIDEKTGKMLTIRSDCIIIDGFICTGDLHRMCPRSIYPYWREAWLRRAEPERGPGQAPVS